MSAESNGALGHQVTERHRVQQLREDPSPIPRSFAYDKARHRQGVHLHPGRGHCLQVIRVVRTTCAAGELQPVNSPEPVRTPVESIGSRTTKTRMRATPGRQRRVRASPRVRVEKRVTTLGYRHLGVDLERFTGGSRQVRHRGTEVGLPRARRRAWLGWLGWLVSLRTWPRRLGARGSSGRCRRRTGRGPRPHWRAAAPRSPLRKGCGGPVFR